MLWGLLGVAGFSLALPATRAAVFGLDPLFVAFGRAALAAVLAALLLVAARSPRPQRRDFGLLAITSAGVVLGFPLFTSLAMQWVHASHAAVVLGLLPVATTACGVWFGRERPSAGFWIFAVLASATVVAYALLRGSGGVQFGDLLLLAAVASAAMGYATGARLAAVLGAWQTICWALVIAMPISVPAMFLTFPRELGHVGLQSWLGFAYVILVSQLLGFFAWYRGLARGGVARVSQIQNLQVFMTMLAGALLLGEPIDSGTAGFAVGATMFVALSRRSAVRSPLLTGVAVTRTPEG